MFRHPLRGFISSIFMLLALSGCFAQTDNSVSGDAKTFAPVMSNSSKDYAKVHNILKKNCVPCHSSDIASYTEAQCVEEGLVVPKQPYQSKLFMRLKGSNPGGDMPQNGPALSSNEIQSIRNWIEDMGEGTTPPTPPAPTTPFGKVQAIIKTSCAHCHNKPDDDFGHFSEADFVSNGYVVPGDAMNSDFYAKLIGSGGTEAGTPNMPLKGPALTADQLLDVRNWINMMDTSSPSPSPSSSPDPSPSPSPSSSVAPPTTASFAGPSPAPSASGNPTEQAIIQIRQNFQTNVRPLIQRACMDCHNSHSKPDGFLGLLPGVRQEEWHHIHAASRLIDFSLTFPNWSKENSDPLFFLSQIKNSLEKSTMPPSNFKIFHDFDGKLLTFAETQTIINWIDQSTQLLAAANTSKPTASQFFSSHCLGCHTSSNPSGGLAFKKVGDQITVPTGSTQTGIPFVTRLNPENSAVYLVLLNDSTQRKGLDHMPYGGSDSDADERLLILDWINQSAQ